MLRRFSSLLMLAFAVALAACPKPASAMVPPVHVVADTGGNIAVDCPAAGQNVTCLLTVRDSLNHVTLANALSVPVGSNAWTGRVACTAPNQPILIVVTAIGVTATGKQSAPSAPVFGSATCPDNSTAAVPSPVIRILIGPP